MIYPGMQGLQYLKMNEHNTLKKIKDINHMIISVGTEKAFYEIQHLFMIKTLSKVGIQGKYLNIIKSIFNKPTANIILNGEHYKCFP